MDEDVQAHHDDNDMVQAADVIIIVMTAFGIGAAAMGKGKSAERQGEKQKETKEMFHRITPLRIMIA